MSIYKKVRGAQVTQAEREFIKFLASEIENKFDNPRIMNIGVKWGCSMWCLRAGSSRGELYGLDIDFDSCTIHAKDELNAVWILGDSTQYWKDFGNTLHLLFIDGDHHKEIIEQDLNWTYKVVVGGIVAFHDYAPSIKNVKRFPHLLGVKESVDTWLSEQPDLKWAEIPGVDSIRAFRRMK